MKKLTYINISQKEANRKIWNSLMDKYVLLKEKNIILAYLWFPIACILFGFVAMFSWLNLLTLLFKDIQFYPHYMRTVIEYNKMDKEEEKEYLDKQYSDYKNRVSYGNLTIDAQSQINATFELLYKKNADKFQKITISQQPEIINKNFKSTLNDKQVEIVVECMNKINVLEIAVTSDLLKQILLCELKKPLKIGSKKNKLLIYLFTELSNRYYIVREWQAVCAQNNIFLSSEKGRPLTQDNISTTVNNNLENPPKDSHIIDKYIKQLQQH
ncbi:hypothetical protein G7051_15710 [Dysgonomonas sp. HDW5B]|uniref:hypothetical protein n=1 Tax=Dysgonomonas sp. HDW5B TaxID=2714927 RepID=UPI00140CA0D3|nr:hypothetical protein [Dysgonomonas sp. HDW5B]QIK55716.1 hypothetical protein G7051_15710 [Dysgonomonas sp. HDW5B]